jgi:2-hydroxycyclohexanecarboxyl-CoA dehydrogenase
MGRFEAMTALVTGGAAGIGWATARRLAEEGAKLAILDSSGRDVERASTALAEAGVEHLARHSDVRERGAISSLVDEAMDRWGRLDVAVANAGARAFGSLLDATDEDWERILAVNLRAVGDTCVAAAKAMRAAGHGGAIVIVSSANALIGRADMPIYDATKAGVLSLARSLAVDLAPDIRVNSVCPGFTVTDFHIRRAEAAGRTVDELRATRSGLLQRPADPAELAAAIAFLASRDASYITGTNLMVDAGRHII